MGRLILFIFVLLFFALFFVSVVSANKYYLEASINVGLLEGDVNNDCKVDIFDLAMVGLAYGSQPGDDNWNPDADLNNDSKVDIFDLATVGLNYGKSC